VLPAADRREDGYFVAVGESGGIAVAGLVAVDPHARAVEHRSELGAVSGARGIEELTEGRGLVPVVGTPGRLARLCEQPQPNSQRRS
jgi:hypothetical protein